MNKRLLAKLQESAKRIDWESPATSFRAVRHLAERVANLHEANSESTFGWLLRSAVQEFSNTVYKDLPVIYPNFVTEVGSRRRSELYGGLYRPNLPRQVDAGEKFQDTAFKGFERELINYKYGHLISFERELFDDDQTGVIRTRAAELGEGFRTFEEIFVLWRLFGFSGEEEGVDVPASTYNGGAPFTTAIGNRPTTYVRLTADSLEAAHIAARGIVDPVGRKFIHVPTTLIVSPIDEFTALRLINSPAMPVTSTGVFSGMVNPLAGRYTVYSSPFIPSKAWMIGDPKRGFVFQRRDPLEIVQENPLSGSGFIQEVYNFRARERFGADWVEPRFAYLGSDGSV